jgi:hypothetical protein
MVIHCGCTSGRKSQKGQPQNKKWSQLLMSPTYSIKRRRRERKPPSNNIITTQNNNNNNNNNNPPKGEKKKKTRKLSKSLRAWLRPKLISQKKEKRKR